MTSWRFRGTRAAVRLIVFIVSLGVIGPFMITPSRVQAGEIHGHAVLAAPGVEGTKASGVAVYLEATDLAQQMPKPIGRIRIDQSNARFVPNFLVVAAGQTLEMPNHDRFMHNVFSYSRPNEFDLGVYPQGESRNITLDHPGIVRVYCSIHESMRAVIVVSPTPYFATTDSKGSFRIVDVPAGEYRIRTFNEPLPSANIPVRIGQGESLNVDVEIGRP
jgi:plastocyanin